MGLHKDLGYSGKQFDKLGSLIKLRNQVAHPNRSIITQPYSVGKLWKQIVRIEDMVDKLNNPQRIERK